MCTIGNIMIDWKNAHSIYFGWVNQLVGIDFKHMELNSLNFNFVQKVVQGRQSIQTVVLLFCR